ncbi:hypothetical protein FACS1894218_5570 [Bacilli bacterium]|nr:hypothetical protein FACS1894218_5570 [Bacilli bacterium]
MGSLYTDLLQDARFLYVGNQKWRLREFATSAEIIKYKNALYDFTPEVVEDDAVTIINVGKDEQLLEEEQYNSDEMDDEDDEAPIKKTSHAIEDDEEGDE